MDNPTFGIDDVNQKASLPPQDNPTRGQSWACSICERHETWGNYPERFPEKKAMVSQRLCYGCAWWNIAHQKIEGLVAIKGQLFILSANPATPFNPFGSRRFLIELPDGQRKETRGGLWPLGTIPDRVRGLYPAESTLIECDPMVRPS